MRVFLGLLALGVASAAEYAVIVAGSKGFGNYRHQADACHAYQVLLRGGMSPDNIILMMQDDVANHPSNPFPGKLFNKPTAAGTPGVDVYEGCKIDYKGPDATAANWISVITGDEKAMQGKGTGRVLKSTKSDNVFLNFVDHGGVGIIAFPNGPYLKAKDLNDALNTMYKNEMYDKLVFYMEACESGSMFNGILPTDQNIFATTAANEKESSWGTYCPPQDIIDGTHVKSCLGDLYSVNWMEEVDSKGYTMTLMEHFEMYKNATAKSHVMKYGTETFTSDKVGDYIGPNPKSAPTKEKNEQAAASAVSSRDIPLHLSYYEYLRTDNEDIEAMQKAGEALKKEIDSRLQSDMMFSKLVSSVAGSSELLFSKPSAELVLECDECCSRIHDAMLEQCGGYTDYSMRYASVVPNLCSHVNHDVEMTDAIIETMSKLCA